MVSEYSEAIFQYMSDLDECFIPNPNYMDGQSNLTLEMHQTLFPETIWIAINIDCFLTERLVSIAKLQLVSITAIFITSSLPSTRRFIPPESRSSSS